MLKSRLGKYRFGKFQVKKRQLPKVGHAGKDMVNTVHTAGTRNPLRQSDAANKERERMALT
jgi:hypothetical protein